jgi:acetyltransferase
MVLVATRRDPDNPEETQILAVGRLTKLQGRNEAEFGVLVGDTFQGRGLGTVVLQRLIEVGRAEGLDHIIGYILPDNGAMLNLAKELGFKLHRDTGDNNVMAVLDL